MSLKKALFLSVFYLPLQDPAAWRHETYSSIAPNELQFSNEGLFLKVKHSSSPLFFKLPPKSQVTHLEVAASTTGLPKLKAETAEGDAENDDFVFRIGFIQPGEYRPSWVERIFAPRWILRLLDYSGEDEGLDKVTFFDVCQTISPGTPKKKRDRFYETLCVKQATQAGDISYSHPLNPPVTASAVWLHADGDNTQSEFQVSVKKIGLTFKE